MNGYVVGLTCYESKDDYGKYYQMRIYINNQNSQSVTFDPNEVNAYLINKKGEAISLEVYTNEEFQKKVKRTAKLGYGTIWFFSRLNCRKCRILHIIFYHIFSQWLCLYYNDHSL